MSAAKSALKRLRIVAISACAIAVLSAGCERQTQQPQVVTPPPDTLAMQAKWMRTALERNPDIEVVAADSSAGIFTIRFKRTGEVRAVKSTEIAAVPIAELIAAARAQSTVPTPEAIAAMDSSTTTSSIPSAAASGAVASPPAVNSSATAAEKAGYTMDRSDGQLKVTGPGVSIVSSGTTTSAKSQGEQGQRTVEPIICEGHRMLHFDNRSIYVNGDAIIARGGCDLYITNSRIVAENIAVIAQDATVHISNSTLEGRLASFSAGAESKVYVRSSTLLGVPRRDGKATVLDQGGNQWK